MPVNNQNINYQDLIDQGNKYKQIPKDLIEAQKNVQLNLEQNQNNQKFELLFQQHLNLTYLKSTLILKSTYEDIVSYAWEAEYSYDIKSFIEWKLNPLLTECNPNVARKINQWYQTNNQETQINKMFDALIDISNGQIYSRDDLTQASQQNLVEKNIFDNHGLKHTQTKILLNWLYQLKRLINELQPLLDENYHILNNRKVNPVYIQPDLTLLYNQVSKTK